VSAFFGRTLSDEHLGRRLAAGEAPAFDELYRRYVHRLAAYGTHLLGDSSAGDDVAQVALMRAYQALREGRVPDALGSWLYRVAHNAAIDSVRHRRELPTELLPENAPAQRPAEVGALTNAIAALPERQRKVFVLRELHGLRIGEAAAELGLSNAQVEQALFAARNRLAEQLVFGERLSCAAVQRLAAGPLDARERRALKTHVRSCPSCRKQLGLRGVALTLPLPPLGWIRAALGGGGAPAVAKIGAVAATAVVAGVPLAMHRHDGVSLVRPIVSVGPDVPLVQAATRPTATPAIRHVVRRHVAAQHRHTAPVPAAFTAPAPVVSSVRVTPLSARPAASPHDGSPAQPTASGSEASGQTTPSIDVTVGVGTGGTVAGDGGGDTSGSTPDGGSSTGGTDGGSGDVSNSGGDTSGTTSGSDDSSSEVTTTTDTSGSGDTSGSSGSDGGSSGSGTSGG
jgi:RNA polymerase sigma factor (sigma-70 family)